MYSVYIKYFIFRLVIHLVITIYIKNKQYFYNIQFY